MKSRLGVFCAPLIAFALALLMDAPTATSNPPLPGGAGESSGSAERDRRAAPQERNRRDRDREEEIDDEDDETVNPGAKRRGAIRRAAPSRPSGDALIEDRDIGDNPTTGRSATAPRPPISRSDFTHNRNTSAFVLVQWERPSRDISQEANSLIDQAVLSEQDMEQIRSVINTAQQSIDQTSERIFSERAGLGPLEGARSVGRVKLSVLPRSKSVGWDNGLPLSVAEMFVERYHLGGDVEVAKTTRSGIENELSSTDNKSDLAQYFQAHKEQIEELQALKERRLGDKGRQIDQMIDDLSRRQAALLDNIYKVTRDFSGAFAGTEVFKENITKKTNNAVILGSGANGVVYSVLPNRGSERAALKTESSIARGAASVAAGIAERHTHTALRNRATHLVAEAMGAGELAIGSTPARIASGKGYRDGQLNEMVIGGEPANVVRYKRAAVSDVQGVRESRNFLRSQIEKEEAEIRDLTEQRDAALEQLYKQSRDITEKKRIEDDIFRLDTEIQDRVDNIAINKQSLEGSEIAKTSAINTNEIVYERVHIPNPNPGMDFADPAVIQQFAQMELIDLVTGQIDRHADNYLMIPGTATGGAAGNVTSAQLKMIDSDLSFGTINEPAQVNGTPNQRLVPSQNAPDIPRYFDLGIAILLLKPKFGQDLSARLAPYLTPVQRAAMIDRINRLRESILPSSDAPILLSSLVKGPNDTLSTLSSALGKLPAPLRNQIVGNFARLQTWSPQLIDGLTYLQRHTSPPQAGLIDLAALKALQR